VRTLIVHRTNIHAWSNRRAYTARRLASIFFTLHQAVPELRQFSIAVGLHKERCRHFKQNAGNAIAYASLQKNY